MALSNWLTRGEWNTAFFSYLALVLATRNDGEDAPPYPCDLSFQLRVGICLMDVQGYKAWTGVTVADNSNHLSVRKEERSRYGARAVTAEGDNSACLVEVMEGRLDVKARARETLAWMDAHPELDAPFTRVVCERIAADG
jgi:hypothetical protein